MTKKYILPKNVGSIDKNIAFPICNKLTNFINKFGITPNEITSITLIIRTIILFRLYHKKSNFIDILLYAISWITDALDGHIARNLNMKSKIGAIYDPMVDITTHIALYIILYIKIYKKKKKELFVFITISIIITILYTCKDIKKEDIDNIKIWEKIFFKIYEKFKLPRLNDINGFVIGPGLNYSFHILFLTYTIYSNN